MKNIKKIAACFLLLSVFLISGCKHDVSNSKNPKTYEIKLNFSIKGAVPSKLALKSNSRMAAPSVDQLIYEISTYNSSSDAENSYLARTYFSDKAACKITFPKAGSYNLRVNAYDASSKENCKADNLVLKGSSDCNTNNLSECTIILSPDSSQGTGTVNVEFCIFNVTVPKCKAVWGDGKSYTFNPTNESFYLVEEGDTDKKIPAGSYTVSFYFYSDTECKNQIYFCREVINVFKNMETNYWVINASAPHYSDDGFFEINEETLTKYNEISKTEFYVDASSSKENPDGTFFSPYSSVQAAVNSAVNANSASENPGTDVYRVFLKSDATISDYTTFDSGKACIDISSDEALKIELLSYGNTNHTITNTDNTNKPSLIHVGQNVELAMCNVGLSGGYAEKGGAIYVDGKLALGNNIQLNQGAIYTETPVYLNDNLGNNFSAKLTVGSSVTSSVLENGVSGQNYVETNYTKFTLVSKKYKISNLGTLVKDITEGGTIQNLIYSSQTPSEKHSYTLSSQNELVKLAEWVNNGNSMEGVEFYLSGPVDLTGVDFAPIGKNNSNYFKGYFDGGDFLISGLQISDTSKQYVALFGCCNGAEIYNVRIKGEVSANQYCAGIVACGIDTIIGNCINAVEVKGYSYCGGVLAHGYDCQIFNCINIGKVTAYRPESSSGYLDGNYSGGIIGKGNTSYVKIYNCANLADVTGVNYVGGICGDAVEESVFWGVYSSGEITGSSNAGEICGYYPSTYENVDNSDYYCSINPSAKKDFGSQSSDYVLYQDSGSDLKSILTTAINENPSSFELNQWEYSFTLNGTSYPVCLDMSSMTETSEKKIIGGYEIECSLAELKENGETPVSPYNYSLSTSDELHWLSSISGSSTLANVTFVLENDITLEYTEENPSFEPIGSSSTKFSGVVDGNGKLISNLRVNKSVSYSGLFGYINNGAIIKNLMVEGEVKGTGNCGGIVGYAQGGSSSKSVLIDNCISNVKVISSNSNSVGGLVGNINYYVEIRDCVNLNDVTGVNYIGGIVGAFSSSSNPKILNCVNFGNISATTNVAGGLVGSIYTGAQMSNCYNYGKVSIPADKTGFGAITGEVSSNASNVTNVYIIEDSCKNAYSDKAVEDSGVPVIPKTSAGMASLKSSLSANLPANCNAWDYTYSIDSILYPVPVASIVNVPPRVTSDTGNKEDSGEHKVLDESYLPMTDFSSTNIPEAGTKVKLSGKDDLLILLNMSYRRESGVEYTNSLKDVTFTLSSDIDMQGVNFTGFGSAQSSKPFQGVIDGNGYEIKNLEIKQFSSGWSGCGLVSYAGDGTVIKNLKLTNVTVKEVDKTNPPSKMACLIGVATGSVTIENCYVDFSYDATNPEYTNQKGRLGALIGHAESSAKITIRNCIATGSLRAASYVGGFIGGDSSASEIIIENSACYCDISSKNGYNGGLSAASGTKTVLKNCFFGGTIEVTNSHNGPLVLEYKGTAENYDNIFYGESSMNIQNQYYTYPSLPTGVTLQTFTQTTGSYTVDYENLMDILNFWANTNSTETIVYDEWDYEESSGRLILKQFLPKP